MLICYQATTRCNKIFCCILSVYLISESVMHIMLNCRQFVLYCALFQCLYLCCVISVWQIFIEQVVKSQLQNVPLSKITDDECVFVIVRFITLARRYRNIVTLRL